MRAKPLGLSRVTWPNIKYLFELLGLSQVKRPSVDTSSVYLAHFKSVLSHRMHFNSFCHLVTRHLLPSITPVIAKQTIVCVKNIHKQTNSSLFRENSLLF